jgi:hypothetical protein
MKKKQDISPVQFLLILLGVLAWVIAGIFAGQDATVGDRPFVPNIKAAAGVLGFAVAGGLCFLGFGIGGWKNKDEGPPPPPPSTPAA